MKKTLGFVGFALALSAASPLVHAQTEFPYEQELFLDVKPLPGSKRVPMLEIFPDGRVVIDLWCKSGPGRAEVSGDEIKITIGPLREERCTPDRIALDDALAPVLEGVTKWSVEDDLLVLSGASELRYRLSTH
jgi:hypothetical protein